MTARACLAALLITGCSPDATVVAFKRILKTADATYDAGMVAVGDRQTMQIFVQSTGRGDVTMFDISVDDPEHWLVRDEVWKTDDADGDGILDSQPVEGGSDASPSYGLVEVVFSPEDEDEYRTTLTIESNDTEVSETTDDGHGIWKIVLRGIGRYPCLRIRPTFHDFGPQPSGGYFRTFAELENCGVVTATVADFEMSGDSSFYVDSPTPIYVLPSDFEEIEVGWQPGSVDPATALLTPVTNDPAYEGTMTLIGNDCELSVDRDWDDDGDGWFECGGDCDDTNASINPSAQEKANGYDDDCDGDIDETANSPTSDKDADGYTENDGDCDDENPEVFPGAAETQNQIDDDCDGQVDNDTEWSDDDGDGYSEREGDCNDALPLVHPGAEETLNGVDDDCDDLIDDGTFAFDDDADGVAELDSPSDCNDDDPWTFPGAIEDCDDRDNDCDGLIDEGTDDSEGGACAFLVDRIVVTSAKGGCATTGGAGGLGLALAALAALLGRRRRR